MKILLFPFYVFRFVVCIGMGMVVVGVVEGLSSETEEPPTPPIERVVLEEAVVETEEPISSEGKVCMETSIMAEFYDLYHHHIHHHKNHEHPHHILKPIPQVLEELREEGLGTGGNHPVEPSGGRSRTPV